MVVVLVLLTFAALVALDHFVFSKRYQSDAVLVPARAPLRPLTAAYEPVPVGVFLQPTFTWGRLGEWGEVYLGVHPMLAELVGSPMELDLREPGEYVEKGDSLVSVGRGGRRLTIRAPVSGQVELVKRPASGDEASWRNTTLRDGAWLYRIAARRLVDELDGWLDGDEASAWTRRRYDELRTFLQGAVADRHLGVVMADGGELPAGILGEMDEHVWAGLEERFLAPPAATPEDRP